MNSFIQFLKFLIGVDDKNPRLYFVYRILALFGFYYFIANVVYYIIKGSDVDFMSCIIGAACFTFGTLILRAKSKMNKANIENTNTNTAVV